MGAHWVFLEMQDKSHFLSGCLIGITDMSRYITVVKIYLMNDFILILISFIWHQDHNVQVLTPVSLRRFHVALVQDWKGLR